MSRLAVRHFSPRSIAVLPVVLHGALLASCGDPLGVDVEPITQLPRALSVAETEVVERSTEFGLDLLGEVLVDDDRPNVILSPLSASMALGMSLNGAEGGTFDAMRTGLGFGALDQTEINAAYRDLITLLTDLDPTVRFEIANAVWTRLGVDVHPGFLAAVEEAFDAEVDALDFSDPASVDVVNGWVDDRTDGLIDRIVDQLDPALVALLVNAIYFDGAWTDQFDPDDTRRQSFERADGSTVMVDMMSISDVELGLGSGVLGDIPYGAVELPYGGGAFSMLVVVPYGDARAAAGLMDAAAFEGVIAGLAPVEVDGVSIPKFTLSYDTYLNDALKRMGMDVAFDDRADFSRLAPGGDDLCISFVRQKTFMEVDERGTRAAAATAVGIGPTSFIGLSADRPFIMAIRERLSGALLFLGVVGDPTAADTGPTEFTNTCG